MPANAAEFATVYRRRGWFPIPIPTRSKVPPLQGWNHLRIAIEEIPKYFVGAMNVGVLTGAVSKHLVDIDLDSQSAVRLAPRFLSSTIMFGRKSKPLSHWIYTAYGARTEVFSTPSKLWGKKELDGKLVASTTILEIRADGKQTIFPHGIHESGEAIEWATDFEQPPSEIGAEPLRMSAARLATACLLVHFGWSDEDAIAFAAHPNPTAISRLAPEVGGLVARWLGSTAAPRDTRRPAAPAPPAPESSFEIAVTRWNGEHPIAFMRRNTGPCPVCHDGKSFGQLKDNPNRWSCFSTDHPNDVGIPSPNKDCFLGDALDLEAFKRGKTRTQVLREDGYLVPHLKVVHRDPHELPRRESHDPPQRDPHDPPQREPSEQDLAEQEFRGPDPSVREPAPSEPPAGPTLTTPSPDPTPPQDAPPPTPPSEPPADDDRPSILLSPEAHEVVDQVISALLASTEVFQRGCHLVRVTVAARSPMHTQIFGPTPTIEPLTPPTVIELITKYSKVFKYDARKKDYVHTLPPPWLVSSVVARGNWRGIRPLEGLVEVPTMRLDGSVLDVPGYDKETGLIYQPTVAFPMIKEKPTRDDAEKAIQDLLDLVGEFPFAAPAALYKSAWLAALLTPFVRTSIPTAPMFLVDSNIRGSGKSKLCDVISIIATGRPMPRTVNPPHDEEFKKLVTSLAIAGSSLVMIDNVTGSLGSQALDAVITAATWKDRILGKSEMTKEIPLTTVWFATGNNVELKGDLVRRTIHIRLKTNDEAPETRQNFKYANLIEYVRGHRSRYVADALTVLRAYVTAGSPVQQVRSMDFREWSDVVRSTLVWAGMEDPAETQIELSQADSDRVGLGLLLDALDRFPDSGAGLSTSTMLRYAAMGGDDGEALKEAIGEMCPTRDGRLPSAVSLGKRLGSTRGRVVEGRCIDRERSGMVWYVKRVTKGDI